MTDPKYGAKGDGKSVSFVKISISSLVFIDDTQDDTEAIKKAVADFKMCGQGCYSSTTKGAIIYFPPGMMLIYASKVFSYKTRNIFGQQYY